MAVVRNASRTAASRIAGSPAALNAGLVRAQRAHATRRRILSAALEEFAHAGFDRTRVSTIGERAGVANGTVFFHFATKPRLYLEVVGWAADRFYRAVSPVAAGPSTDFMRVIDREFAFRQDHPSIDALLASLRGEHPQPVVREAARRLDARVLAIWRRWVAAQRAAAGRRPTAGSANVTRLIASTVSGVFSHRAVNARADVQAVLGGFAVLLQSQAGKEWIVGAGGVPRSRRRQTDGA